MNDLEKYFRQNTGRAIHKCAHYFDIYERHFSQYRNKDVVLLEIGLGEGGSLQLWKDYFGPGVRMYGIDNFPECKQFEEEGVHVFIGSQSDRKFLRETLDKLPPIDILIDDGGHTMSQQIVSFEELFGKVKRDGIYLCEDLHTSYWLKYGGGYKRRGTFIEYSKNLIDRINAQYSEQHTLKEDLYTHTIAGLHYYNGMLVIEKGEIPSIAIEKTGNPSFSTRIEKRNLPVSIYKPVYAAVYLINRILRFFRLPGIIWK